MKSYFLLIAFVASVLYGYSQKTGCVSGDCANGFGKYIFSTGDYYVGEFKGNQQDGFGVYYYTTGSIYCGSWKKAQFEGWGTFKWNNGDKYTGDWKNSKRSGQGIYFFANGTKKSGDWKDDTHQEHNFRTGCISGNCDNGWGIWVWGENQEYPGDRYEGYWENMQMTGQGTYYYTEGSKYVGTTINNKRTGKGVLYYYNGDKYDVAWKNDKKDGYGSYFYYDTGDLKTGYWVEGTLQSSGITADKTGTATKGCITGNCVDGTGTYKFDSGAEYIGEFKNSTYNGFGTYMFGDGQMYIGDWKDGKYDGYGTMIYKDGTSKVGYWNKNSYLGTENKSSSGLSEKSSSSGCISGDCDNGYGTYVFPSGEKYEGYWVNKMRNGYGTNFFTTGAKYIGNWKDDKRHGYGISEYASSSKYEKYLGNFVDDKLTGQGTLYHRDGTIESGNWNDNVFQGAYSSDYTYNAKKGSKGCVAGNCTNGYGMYTFDNGDKFVGEWVNGVREGQGVYFYNSGAVYTGNFKNNTLSGYGYCKWASGSFYLGDWADGAINGQGIYTYEKGTKDIGSWKNTALQNATYSKECISGNCENGFGIYIWGSDTKWAGQKYIGYWKNGKRNGQGTYYYGDGSKYSGNFVDNSLSGHGAYFWNNGNKFEGSWNTGKMEGYGTYFYADDATTETGYWSDGKFVGNSKSDYAFSNNKSTSGKTTNIGCISGNCDDGFGTYVWENGEKYTGAWLNMKRNGEGTNYFTSGAVYKGFWKNDMKNGIGTYTYKKESIYDKYIGNFVDEKMTGKGELYYRDGSKYLGQFYDNLFQGEGSFWHADGTEEKGTWANDKLVAATGNTANNTTGTKTSDNNNSESSVKDDVNTGIPEISTKNPYRFALIFGNEDYSSYQEDLKNEANVDFAESDARVFKDYAVKTFGIPDENVIMKINAKAMEMHKELNKLNLLIKSANGKAEVFFYYAGHGVPEESTKEPYLLPVDVSGTDLQFAVKLADVYRKLSEYPSKKVTIFLDACFSGGARNKAVVNARAVKIKPKETPLKGNLVIFASSSGEQTSLAYKDAKHGMFTYHLLKKLKETKGDVSYKELAEYLNEQVGMKSVLVNNKEQTPQTITSPEVQDRWGLWKIRE